MALYRIICGNKERGDAFAEPITAPLQLIDNQVYYTDARGRSWNCTYEFARGRIVTDPEIIAVIAVGYICRMKLNTGRRAHLTIDCIETLRKFRPETAERRLNMIERAIIAAQCGATEGNSNA